MKKRSRHIHILFIAIAVAVIVPFPLSGQITSSTADHSQPLKYPAYSEASNLFVIYQVNGSLKPGSLTATLPGSGSFNFDWSKYDSDSQTFIPYQSDLNAQSSVISDLEEGGYQVRIWNGIDTDTSFLGWVMLNGFVAETEKTADNKVKPYKYTCDFLVLTGAVFIDTFYYYDPISFDTIMVENDFRFKWTSDNPDLDIPGDTIFLRNNYTELPPVVDTWYILTATDNLGMRDIDSVLYESIHTRAEFTVEYKDKIKTKLQQEDIFDPDLTGSFDPAGETGSLDALLTVRFLNESVNGNRYEWVYLDTIGSIKEYEYTYDLETQPEHVYEDANKYYYPYMVSISEADCMDTFRLEEAIHVEPSQLDIPNVFTPNGDGLNDIFIFKHQSIKSFELTIIDRFGAIVYKKETGNIYNDWEGWDGNLRNSSREAPAGQYYYIIKAMGYDNVEYRDPYNSEKKKGGSSGSGGTTPPTGDENASAGLYTGWLYLFREPRNF